MMAMSMWNPYAMLVALGHKRVETRSFWWSYRGPVAIYATKSFDADSRDFFYEEPCRTIFREAGFREFKDLPFGRLVALTTLADCRKIRDEDDIRIPASWAGVPRGDDFYYSDEFRFGLYHDGRYMSYLRDAVRFETPIPARPPGQQQLWPVPEDVQALIRGALGGRPLPRRDCAEGGLFG